MISKEEVQRIAKLARLELSDGEVVKMQKDLTEILAYFDLLKKAPAPSGRGSPSEFGRPTSLRSDQVISNHDIAVKLIANAPDKKDDYIKVKAIF